MKDTVFLVDDDASIRDSVGLLLGLNGFRVALFADAEAFLKAMEPDWTGCLVTDIRMSGASGLDLIDVVRSRGCDLSVIVITGHGDVASARHAFKADAVDFLEKPIDGERLINALGEAMQRQSTRRERLREQEDFCSKVATLTPREVEVMQLVVAGRSNRDIGQLLGISVRTVEVHKSRILAKTGAMSVTHLVRLHIETYR